MRSRSLLAALTAATLLLLPLSAAQADPSVDYLDPLIAELEARSAALEGSEDKDEQKQKKTIDKLLKGFAKESKGPDKDLKAAGKAAKKLAKVFPEEFSDPAMLSAAVAEDDLADLIQQALELFGGDVDAILAQAQDLVDMAPTGCADKAQAALDKVVMIVEEAGDPNSGNLPDYAKALAKALKKGLKVEAKALKAQDCTPKTPKLKWNIGIATVNGMSYVADALDTTSGDQISGVDFGNGTAFLAILESDGLNLNFYIPTSEGPHNVFNAQFTPPPGMDFQLLNGSVTITKYPSSIPGRAIGTFDFGNGTAVGSFNIYVTN